MHGDGTATLVCTRPYKHRGLHKTSFKRVRGQEVIIRWKCDERAPHERPEGGPLYNVNDDPRDIFYSLVNCFPLENKTTQMKDLEERSYDIFDDVSAMFDEDMADKIRELPTYPALLSEAETILRSLFEGRYVLGPTHRNPSIVELRPPKKPPSPRTV